jgi:hypothetical protein
MTRRAAILVILLSAVPATAFIDVHRPATLGAVCARAQGISVLKVVKAWKEKGRWAVAYEVVADLKGKFPRRSFRQVCGPANEPHEVKGFLDWAREGETVVVFRYENRYAICHGRQWSVVDGGPPKDAAEEWAFDTRTEPAFLSSYRGPVAGLRPAVEAILAGKEVVVPVMLGKRDKELRRRDGEVIRMRSGLKILVFDEKRHRVKE